MTDIPRKSDDRRASLVRAAYELIAADGLEGLRTRNVAARAGVNKTTIYRRWPTLDDLLVDALMEWSHDALPAMDTGSVETDLLALGGQLADVLNAGVGRQVVALVLTAGLRSAQLRETTRRYFDHQALRAIPIVNQAIDRGELPADTDANALLTTFRAPLFYRLVTTGDPIDEELVTQAARVTLTAARAGLLSR